MNDGDIYETFPTPLASKLGMTGSPDNAARRTAITAKPPGPMPPEKT